MFLGPLTTAGNSTVSRNRRVVALTLGCLIAGGIGLASALGGSRATVLGALGLAPFITAILGAVVETAFVAALATGIALAGLLSEQPGFNWTFFVRLGAVALTGVLSVVVVAGRQRRELTRERFELLTRMSRIGNTIESVPDTAARLAAMIVPQFADVAVFDLTRGGRRRRVHVRASGPRAERIESFLRRHGPDQPLAVDPSGAQLSAGQPTLVEQVGYEELRRWTQTREDRAELTAMLEGGSVISLPLQARGEIAGTMTLLVSALSGRHYGRDELDFATVLGGRAALALEIAGLTRHMTQLEQRLVGALGDVSDAIIVLDRSGVPLYASETALALLGLDSFEELSGPQAGAPGTGLEIFTEQIDLASPEDLPGRRILRGEREAPAMLLMRASTLSGEERWLRISSRGIRDAEDQLLSVVSTLEDVTEGKRTELTNRMLTRASELLSASLDYATVVRRISEIAVERLADFCAVFLPDARGGLARVTIAGTSGERGQRMLAKLERWPDSPNGIESALSAFTDARTLVMNDISDATLVSAARDSDDLALWRDLGLTASMTVPLLAAGRPVGAMALIIARPGRRFGESDQALAEELARRAGQAIENARSYTTRSAIASTLQEALRPPELVAPAGWEVASWYVPAGEESTVGGDFYDVFPVIDGHFALIGDVTGHGALAARLTSLARFTLRTAAELTQDPRTAIHRLDAALASQPEIAPVSAVCAHFADRQGQAVVARLTVAGHPLPILIRDGHARAVGQHGPVAGAATGADWTETPLEFRAGDAFVLYTDGVTDARREAELFGTERMLECLHGCEPGPEEIAARISAAVASFQSAPPQDDMTVVALRCVSVPDVSPRPGAAPRRRRWALAPRRRGRAQ